MKASNESTWKITNMWLLISEYEHGLRLSVDSSTYHKNQHAFTDESSSLFRRRRTYVPALKLESLQDM